MKYVFKKPLSYIIDGIAEKRPRFIHFKRGDILEYVGVDESRNFEFKDKFGQSIFMDSGSVDYFLNDVKEPIHDKLCVLLRQVCKIEADVAGLRGQLESILLDLE